MISGLLHDGAVLVLTYALLYFLIVLTLALLTPARVMPGGQRVRVRFRAWLPRWAGHDGLTVFGIIWIADTSAPADLVAHEYRHTQQERRLGYVAYLPVYYVLMWRARSYYLDGMEADARQYARLHAREFTSVTSVGGAAT